MLSGAEIAAPKLSHVDKNYFFFRSAGSEKQFLVSTAPNRLYPFYLLT